MTSTLRRAADVVTPLRSSPIAVIDVGSNSIRLVVYSGLTRGAVTLFNEKVLCGLGRGLARSGRLNPEGVALARQNLVRFSRLARAMGVARIDMLATAAVREAEDGAAFATEVEQACGLPLTVLDGEEEARLSALGVVAGFPGATGAMGDLGGGSLELVELRDGTVGRSATLPLGPFQLMDLCGDDTKAMAREIDKRLKAVDWLIEMGKGDPGSAAFYAVGGAWRNLARIHIQQTKFPLHVIHGYTLRRGQVVDLARVISGLGRRSLKRIKGVTKERLETLPAAALVLSRVVRALGGGPVIVSAYGLREGHAYDLLAPEEQAQDPLLAVCTDIARRDARFEPLGESLVAWTDALFPNEPPAPRRLRTASCLLSDIAWREHPDYRAVQARYRILCHPLVGLSHAERAFLAHVAFVRYGGGAEDGPDSGYLDLLSAEQKHDARVLGLAQRLAYRVSGATRVVLERCSLRFDADGVLELMLPDDGSAPRGEAVQRRLDTLAREIDTEAKVIES